MKICAFFDKIRSFGITVSSLWNQELILAKRFCYFLAPVNAVTSISATRAQWWSYTVERMFWKIIITSVDVQWRVTDWSSADEKTNNVRWKVYIVKLFLTYFLQSSFKLFLLSCGQNIKENISFVTHCYFPRNGPQYSHNVIQRSTLEIFIYLAPWVILIVRNSII